MTGVILRRLEQEKKLSRSDPLGKYIPGFPSADTITAGLGADVAGVPRVLHALRSMRGRANELSGARGAGR